MKKFLKITALVLISLLIFFVGTFKYRQYKANQIAIPKNATSLIKISVDEIYKSLAANIIAHPGFYLKSDLKEDTLSKINKFDHGLKIPASFYFYTIQHQPNTAFFSRLVIDDIVQFENLLKSTLKFQLFKKEGLNYGKSRLGNVVVLYNNDSAALVIFNEVTNFDSVLTNILNQKNQIKIDESNFKNITHATEHIAFQNLKNKGSINFERGLLKFNNEFSSEIMIPSEKPAHRKFNSQSAINMWFNADLVSNSIKTNRFKNISLNSDSLVKYYNGYLDFEWAGSTRQVDSIISYEYNDDFEKVERVTAQNKEVPNLLMRINADAPQLIKYLNSQKLINIDDYTLQKSVFPLYKVFVSEKKQQLILSTKRATSLNSALITTNEFFGLNVNFDYLNTQDNFPFFKPYFKSFKHLYVSGIVTVRNKIRVNGTLTFVNEDINSLYQLLKVM